MKKLLLTSDRSDGGKTTVSLCIMAALKKKGFKVQSYKCGPDYIDTGFHGKITGIPGRNLDSFLQGEDNFYRSFNCSKGDINVVEGVMGFYDGRDNSEDSAWDISQKLNIPVILILTPKGQAQTFCATLKGLLEYRENNIVGLIINRVSQKYFELLKGYIKKENLPIEVLGYMPNMEDLKVPSRHLGLIQAEEINDLIERIEIGGDALIDHVNLDRVVELATIEDNPILNDSNININTNTNIDTNIDNDNKNDGIKDSDNISLSKPTVLIARDEAFSFYYEDSLEILSEYYDIKYFSPLVDKELPTGDLLYLGGGYPELHLDALSNNLLLRKSIKERIENGLPTYGECGGLMYLLESIESKEMVGIFSGNAQMTKTLQHFGYCRVHLENKDMPNLVLNGHEFHKSLITTDEPCVSSVTSVSSKDIWQGGYRKYEAFGQYAHINLKGNREFLEFLYSKSINYKDIREKKTSK